MRAGLLPSHLIVDDGLIGPDFGTRLEAFKEAIGLSWEVLAACLGVDPQAASAVARGHQAKRGRGERHGEAGGPRPRRHVHPLRRARPPSGRGLPAAPVRRLSPRSGNEEEE